MNGLHVSVSLYSVGVRWSRECCEVYHARKELLVITGRKRTFRTISGYCYMMHPPPSFLKTCTQCFSYINVRFQIEPIQAADCTLNTLFQTNQTNMYYNTIFFYPSIFHMKLHRAFQAGCRLPHLPQHRSTAGTCPSN